MKSLSAEARKTSAPKRSSGYSSRLIARRTIEGCCEWARWLGFSLIMLSESVKPGARLLTQILYSPSSRENRARERRHRALRGHVVREVGNAAGDGAGADIDDLAVLLRDHVWRDVLGHEKHAPDIDRHDAVP